MQWLDPDFIFQTVLPALNRGLVMSIALIVPSATIGFVLGVLTGVARVFGPKWLRSLGNGFTTIFRGVPLVVQLMILYFGLPNLGIYLEPYPASVLGFILCTGAYQSEYVRGAKIPPSPTSSPASSLPARPRYLFRVRSGPRKSTLWRASTILSSSPSPRGSSRSSNASSPFPASGRSKRRAPPCTR